MHFVLRHPLMKMNQLSGVFVGEVLSNLKFGNAAKMDAISGEEDYDYWVGNWWDENFKTWILN